VIWAKSRIKGEASFDALRQACIDPAGRAYVGDAPPIGTLPSQVISTVTLSDASWATTPYIQLNPGLVAIIGARGSGKTALADIIAKGCDAGPAPDNQQSFLYRAKEFLDDTSVTLTWGSGDNERRSLTDPIDDYETYPRARYLSQQFVDSLCSSYGMTDALLREIERVIFDAHPVSERDGAVNFNDLLILRASRYRQVREREEEALASLSEQIGIELEKVKLIASYGSQVKEKESLIRRTEADRSRLVAKGSEARLARLHELTMAAERVRQYVRHFNLRTQELLTMQDEVADRRKNKAPDELRASQRQHAASGLKDDDWKPFLTDYVGQVDQALSEKLREAQTSGNSWKGNPPSKPADANASYLTDGADLLRQPLAVLEAEISRLQQLVSIDKATADRFSFLSSRIVQENEILTGLKEKLTDAQSAKVRVSSLQNEREACYQRVIDAILFEQRVLSGLYAPIQTRLFGSNGALRKLSFSITRSADVASWAKRGEEELVDLRRQGQFRGRGSLQQLAEHHLKIAWETGNGAAVSAAMKDFRDAHQEALLDQARVSKADPIEYRAWLKRFAQWLYSTDHITISYSVEYDGTDIRKLSPGTRGIVLLLLYLALDDTDDRPLIIDQPEENLDPKSIYDELVGLFIDAKARRHVIMVTHNANLVINTDADQIIVASVGPHSSGSLPPITYLSGGLDRADIRKAVCDILEGGEHTFRERARRLRVRLQR